MNIALIVVTFVFLFILTFLDFKYKQMPSILTTSYLLGLAILFPNSIIYAGIMALFGLFLYEAKDGGVGGIADIKVMAILGFFIPSATYSLIVIGLILIIGILYKAFSKYVLKYKNETPFLIVFLITFVLMRFLFYL